MVPEGGFVKGCCGGTDQEASDLVDGGIDSTRIVSNCGDRWRRRFSLVGDRRGEARSRSGYGVTVIVAVALSAWPQVFVTRTQ